MELPNPSGMHWIRFFMHGTRFGSEPMRKPRGRKPTINGIRPRSRDKTPKHNATRLHNRCQLTGRPHAYYRKLKISRIALRELGSQGQIPGMVKSSW